MKILMTNMIVVLFVLGVSAQTATLKVMNGAEMKCNTMVNVKGSLENSGHVINNTAISLDNDFSSSNQYSGNGSIEFYNSTPSFISCTDTIHRLVNNKIGSELTLSADLIIREELDLFDGKIDLNNFTLHLGDFQNPHWLFGGSSTSYIYGSGAFRRNLALPEYLEFPFGSAGHYTPTSINMMGGTLNNAWVEASLYDVSHPSMPTTSSNIDRYWAFNTNGISAALYDCTFTYTDGDIVGTEAELLPHIWSGAEWFGPIGSGADIELGTSWHDEASNTITYSGFAELADISAFKKSLACPGDFNGDNQVNTSDLLLFLGEFGCDTACTADLNGDGLVNTADLLSLLSLFGTSCNP